MSVELRPLGVRCNLQCQYCYQNPQRDAGNLAERYDLEKMKQVVRSEGGPFTLFGGEPLLLPLADLEALWAFGLAEYGANAVQTNGTLISDEHIGLFRKYRVQVGISIDGPGELNDVRWHGTLERTRDSTRRTEEAIERLCRVGLPPSLIVTLHRGNATAERLPVLGDWVRYLASLGVRWLRLHLLESESAEIRAKYGLDTAENLSALRYFAALQAELPAMHFDVFDDMRRMLLGEDERTTCVWHACDPYTTAAVRGVEGHGQRSNCGRTNKEGIDFVKADRPGYERYLALYHTPEEHGGCRGCRFFLQCKGQCPGTAIDGDWRNRTEHCAVWKTLYADLEAQLLDGGQLPLSLHPERARLEQACLEAWARGENRGLAELVRALAPSATPDAAGSWRAALGRLRRELQGAAGEAARS